jgi:regulatory protein YycH of two-component signal transduction system YycFG
METNLEQINDVIDVLNKQGKVTHNPLHMKVNPIQQEYLKSVILSQLLLESNESLIFTTQYKQQIKHKINSLNKDLEETVRNEFKIIYNTDPETTTNILRSIEEIVSKLQTSTLDELVFINAVIDKYKENSEWFKEYGETEFLKLD